MEQYPRQPEKFKVLTSDDLLQLQRIFFDGAREAVQTGIAQFISLGHILTSHQKMELYRQYLQNNLPDVIDEYDGRVRITFTMDSMQVQSVWIAPIK